MSLHSSGLLIPTMVLPRSFGRGTAMDRYEQWHLSSDAAERYERVVARYILGPWVRVLVEAAGLKSRERVLDLACGTGLVARAAAERVGQDGRVVGVDLNPGMIAVAQALPAPAGAAID